jgi:2-polyprenyl-6-methoxyphenol hydroxylase-like FAD-dependent oxidoreductase
MVESVQDGWWYGAFLPDRRPLAIFHTSPVIATEIRSRVGAWQERLAATQVLSRYLDPAAFGDPLLQTSDARSIHLDPVYGSGWAACGDAALSFDPLSAQGIFNAVASAEMLVSALERDTWAEYGQALAGIRGINANTRRAFYESAAVHFDTPFWWNQLGLAV